MSPRSSANTLFFRNRANSCTRFFEGLGQVAQYFDSLPLEEKHRIKTGLITLFSKGGAPRSWNTWLKTTKG